MVARSPITWINDNRWLALGTALVVVTAAVTFALVKGGGESSQLTSPGATTDVTQPQAGEPGATPGATGASSRSSATIGAALPGDAIIPGLPGGPRASTCTPAKVKATGVTDKTIKIGQIVTDSNQLPQQLKPVNEGLEAFVKVFNAGGGLCKRKLSLEYRNDGLNPATHNQAYQQLANEVLAFVGNDSLLDFLDYDREPPFEPTIQGGGGKVPDVGGLAFSYGRAQSSWHAGVVGSVSPVLVGGEEFKYLTAEAKAAGKPCTKAGVIYLNEPTGASEDQARLGSVALERSWGGNLGSGNTTLYAANLTDTETNYQLLVDRMAADGMNCAFAYTDLQGSIRLVKAMNTGGYWPPDTCTLGDKCFRVTWVPFAVYDSKFITDGGEGARSVSTFIPHLPINETSTAAVKVYLNALKAVPNARPSSFSIFGFASGLMFVSALQACPAAPTRSCLMDALHKMKAFSASGLLGEITPFRTTRVTYSSFGTFDWKWIFSDTVGMRVLDRGGKRDFYRINPASGFVKGTIKVARGTPG